MMSVAEKGVLVVFTSLSEKAQIVRTARIENLEFELLSNMIVLLQKACA